MPAVGQGRGDIRCIFDRGFSLIRGDRRVGLTDDQVNDAVVLCFGRTHPLIAIDVVCQAFNRLSGVRGQHLLKTGVHADDFARLDLDV